AKAQVGPAGQHEALVECAFAQVIAECTGDRPVGLCATLPQERRVGDRHLRHPVHQSYADRSHLERSEAYCLGGIALVTHLRIRKRSEEHTSELQSLAYL